MQTLHLKRSQIQEEEWNHFIDQTPQNNIYAKTWFLDSVPQDWKAIVIREHDQLIAVLPYQIQQKFGLTKTQQDPFTNELGIYHLPDREDCVRPLLDSFLSHPLISIYKFNPDVTLPKLNQFFFYDKTLLLDLSCSIEEIQGKYGTNLKRNLKKAEKSGVIIQERNDQVEALIEIMETHVLPKTTNWMVVTQFDTLRKLYEEMNSRGVAKIYTAETEKGEILSCAMIARSENKLVYLHGGSTEEGRKNCSQQLLLHSIIAQHAGSELKFDFEGRNGSPEGLLRFYESFGSYEERLPCYRKMYGSRLLSLVKKTLGRG